MADSPTPPRDFYPFGIDPRCSYDSDQFCAILRIAEKRRLKLAAALRDSSEAISNGYSYIAEGAVMLRLLKEIS